MSPAERTLPSAPPAVTLTERRIRVTGGIELAVRVPAADPAPARRSAPGSGSAPAPALLVHGLASNARLWDGVAGRLVALGHPVAAVDQRGHGRSEKVDDGYDWATLTDDLVAVLDGLGWHEPAVVAGQSWGGNVVLELAARHPERLAAAVLVDGGTIELSTSFADWPTAEATLTPPAFAGTSAADMEGFLRRSHPDWPEVGITGTMGNVEVRADGTVAPWLTLPRHLGIVRQLWEHHPPERYPEVAVPVLLVPAGDGSAPPARFEAAKRDAVAQAEAGLAVSATVWVDGDHDLHAQHPDRIAELIDAAADGRIFGSGS